MLFVVLVTLGGSCPCLNKCDAGDVPVYKYNGGLCYRLFWKSATWEDAASECKLDGGKLTEPANVETARYLPTSVTAFQQYVWVGAKLNTISSVWEYRGSGSAVPNSLWSGGNPPAPSPTQHCAFISQDGSLYPWACAETMVYVCEKRQITFTAITHKPTLAVAMSLTIELEGIGLGTDIFITASVDGCSSAVDPRTLIRLVSNDDNSNEFFVTLPQLSHSSNYDICWYGPVVTTTTSVSVNVEATGVKIVTPQKPFLNPAETIISNGDELIHLSGRGLTRDLWVKVNCAQSSSTSQALPVGLPPSSNGTVAFVNISVTPVGLPLPTLYDVRMPICVAVGLATVDVNLLVFEPTDHVIIRKSPPIFSPVNIALTFAESLQASSNPGEGLIIPVSGTHLDQLIYISLSTHPLCSDISVLGVATTTLQHSNSTNGVFTVSTIPFFGQPLYVCYLLKQPQQNSRWTASDCSVYVTPKPVFDKIIVDGEAQNSILRISQQTIRRSNNLITVTIPGRYLSTYSKDESLLWIVYSSGTECLPSTYVIPSTSIQLRNGSPLGAEATLPTADFTLGNVKTLCVIPNLVAPTAVSHVAFGSMILDSYFGIKILNNPSFATEVLTISVLSINDEVDIHGTGSTIPMLDVVTGISLSGCTDANVIDFVGSNGELHEPNHITISNMSSVLPGLVEGMIDEPVTVSFCVSYSQNLVWNQTGVERQVLPRPTATSQISDLYISVLDITQSRTSLLTITVSGTYLVSGMRVSLCSLKSVFFNIVCDGLASNSFCSDATFVLSSDIIQPGSNEQVLLMCFDEKPLGLSVVVLQPPQLYSEGIPSSYSISRSLWEEGFNWTLTGKNIGGIWVSLSNTACDTSRLSESVIQLNGNSNSSNEVISFSPRDHRISETDTSYRLCWRADTPNTAINQFPIPLIVKVMPSFRSSEIEITRAQFVALQTDGDNKIYSIDFNMLTTDLSGSVTIMGILCKESCSVGCTQPFVVESGGFSNVLLPQSLLSSSDESIYKLCWMTEGIILPNNVPSNAYTTTEISITVTEDPVFEYIGSMRAILYESSYGNKKKPIPLLTNNLKGDIFIGLLNVGNGCHNRAIAQLINTTAVLWSPITNNFNSDTVYGICFGYTSSPTDSYKTTTLRYSWGSPPVFTPWTYHIPLTEIGVGEGPVLSLRGTELSPGILSKIIQQGDACTTTLYASRLVENSKLVIPVTFSSQYYGGNFDLCWSVVDDNEESWKKAPGVAVLMQKPPTFSTDSTISVSSDFLFNSDGVIESGGAWTITTLSSLFDNDIQFYGWMCTSPDLQDVIFNVSKTTMTLSQPSSITANRIFNSQQKRTELCWSLSNSSVENLKFRSGVFIQLPEMPISLSSDGVINFETLFTTPNIAGGLLSVTTDSVSEFTDGSYSLFVNCEGLASPVQRHSVDQNKIEIFIPRNITTSTTPMRKGNILTDSIVEVDVCVGNGGDVVIPISFFKINSVPHISSVSVTKFTIAVVADNMNSDAIRMQLSASACDNNNVLQTLQFTEPSGTSVFTVTNPSSLSDSDFVYLCTTIGGLLYNSLKSSVQDSLRPPVSDVNDATVTLPTCDPDIGIVIKNNCFDNVLVSCTQLNGRLATGDCESPYNSCVAIYNCSPNQPESIATLILTLSATVEDYSQMLLKAMVAATVEIHPELVSVSSVASGSIVVTLLLPQKGALEISQNKTAINSDSTSPFSKLGWNISNAVVTLPGQTPIPKLSSGDDGGSTQQYIIPILAAVAVLGLIVLGIFIKKVQIGNSSETVTEKDIRDLVDDPSTLRGGSESTSIIVNSVEMIPPVPPIRSSTGGQSIPSVVSVMSSSKPASHHLCGTSTGTSDINLILTTPTPTRPGGPGGGQAFLSHHTDAVTFGQNRSTDSILSSTAPLHNNTSVSSVGNQTSCYQCGHPWSGGRYCAHCGSLVRRPIPVPHP